MTKLLNAYLISFPENENFPWRIGVTAFSIEDAFLILEYFNYDWHKHATRVSVVEGITWDELEVNNIRPNMGAIVVRGVWYPNLNLGVFIPLVLP